jgi:hypothetical protein
MGKRTPIVIVTFLVRFFAGLVISYIIVAPIAITTIHAIKGLHRNHTPPDFQLDGDVYHPAQIVLDIFFSLVAPNIFMLMPFGWIVYVIVVASALVIAVLTRKDLIL